MYLLAVNLSALDLNLLVALDALVAEVHVGRAASRVGLSQPAMSHALGRLRGILGDPLLVRVGTRMQLTPRAQQLRIPLGEALEQVRRLFVADQFEPSTSIRRFALMVSDHVVDLVMPALVDRIAAEAPNVRLDVTAWRGLSAMTSDLSRSVDLMIACTDHDFAGFRRQRLFGDTEAVAVCKGHPAGGRLTHIEVFREARHVAVVAPGRAEDPVDEWLREKHVARHIALTVPSYLQALHVAAKTDLVAFIPRRLIEALAGPLSLLVIAPPLDPGKYEEFLFYPARTEADPGSIWLRNHVVKIGRQLDRRKFQAA